MALLVTGLCAPPLSSIGATPGSALPGSVPARLTLTDAVRSTLRRDPNIQVQEQQVLLAKGAALTASGQFDLTLDTAISEGVSHTPLTESDRIQDGVAAGIAALRQDVTSYRLGINKQLRSGITLGPVLELSRVADNANQEAAANVARIVFMVTVPLLRGLGRDAVEAPERAARLSAEAAALDLRQTTATRIFNTVSSYWNTRAAEQELAVLRETAERSELLLTNLLELVRTGEFASADVDQARADLAEKQADVRFAEQTLYDAQQALGLALGLTSQELMAPPLARDEFPEPSDPTPNIARRLEALVQDALTRRPDYQSALKAERANEALLLAARNNMKPQLDFNLQAGYTGLDEGSQFRRFFGSTDPWTTTGPNVLGTVRLTFPFANRAARGALEQRQASREQAALRSADLARNIISAVRTSQAQLDSAIHELSRLETSFQHYQLAVGSEAEKMKLGHSTVLDQITLADRWSNMRLKQVQAKARYAVAVVRVRYECGLLVPADAPMPAQITPDDLLTLPMTEANTQPLNP